MDYISVREENAKKIFQPLTDKEISVVCDPTFLPDKEFYKQFVSRENPYGNKKYIYVHVHHYSSNAPELVKAAKELSEKTGMPTEKLASLFFSLRKKLKKELEGKGVNV